MQSSALVVCACAVILPSRLGCLTQSLMANQIPLCPLRPNQELTEPDGSDSNTGGSDVRTEKLRCSNESTSQQAGGNNSQGAGGSGMGQSAGRNGQGAGNSGTSQGAGSNQSTGADPDGDNGDGGGADAGGVPEKFKAAFKAHNSFREQHGAEPLKWSKECAEYAQKQADACSAKGALGHGNMDGPSGRHGQNAAWNQADMGAAVTAWYEEEKDYDYATGKSKGGVVGHFTQVVWKATKEIGMGMSNDKYYVANYLPGGNMMGDEKANVGAKK